VILDSCAVRSVLTDPSSRARPHADGHLLPDTPQSGPSIERRGELRRPDDRSPCRPVGDGHVANDYQKGDLHEAMLPVFLHAFAIPLSAAVQAAAPGISGSTFNLTRGPAYLSQPDGLSVYSWGYGCTGGALRAARPLCRPRPRPRSAPRCRFRVDPGGHGRSVGHGDPDQKPAGLRRQHLDPLPGLIVSATGGVAPVDSGGCPGENGQLHVHGFLAPNACVLQRHAGRPGRSRWACTGIIVVPSSAPTNGTCPTHSTAAGLNTAGTALVSGGESDSGFHQRRERLITWRRAVTTRYLFQFSEMDPNIHAQASPR